MGKKKADQGNAGGDVEDNVHLQGDKKTTAETAVAVRPNFTKEREKKKKELEGVQCATSGELKSAVRKTVSGYKGKVFNNNEVMLTEPWEAGGASI